MTGAGFFSSFKIQMTIPATRASMTYHKVLCFYNSEVECQLIEYIVVSVSIEE